jgi:hypothetical protein
MQTYLFFYDNVLKMLEAMKGNNKKAFRFYAFKVINCKKVLAHNFSQNVINTMFDEALKGFNYGLHPQITRNNVNQYYKKIMSGYTGGI